MDKIPVVINNRNRLTTTKNMVDKLLSLSEDTEIHILDNESTYPPLLDWYQIIRNDKKKYPTVFVVPMANHGHLALWSSGFYKYLPEYFIYTDSDIVLNDNFPAYYDVFMRALIKLSGIDKIGLALSISDLPDHYTFKQQVIRNESRWWLVPIEKNINIFLADTDTTFAMYRNTGDNMYKSLRIAGEFTAKHAPWYHDLNNLDEEEKYYLEHLGERQLTQYSKQHKYPELYDDK